MPKAADKTEDVLSHLKRCPQCKYYVTAPLKSKGQSNDANEGYYYEKCLKNRQPVPNSCKHFAWRQDLGRGKREGKVRCVGEFCREAAKPGAVNGECTFGVCARCCRYIQPRIRIPIPCAVSEHRKGVQTATAPTKPAAPAHKDPSPNARGRRSNRRTKSKQRVEISSDDDNSDDEVEIVEGPGGRAARGRGRGADKQRSMRLSVSPVDDTSDDQVVIVKSRRARAPPPKKESFATPVGGVYVGRVHEMDAENRVRAELLATQARQSVARSHVTSVMIRWWSKEGAEPDVLEIEVENPSAFHPKDSALLVQEYACDKEKFQYYDSKRELWLTGSVGTAPRDLKKLGNEILCFRSYDVRCGPGMPGTNKRTASEASLAPETPRRPLAPFIDYPLTPASQQRLAASPATSPPGSGSSAVVEQPGCEDTPIQFHATAPNRVDTFTAVNLREPPLPALLAQPTTRGSSPVEVSEIPTPHVDILDVRRGPRSPWPFKYVCDMAHGFELIEEWKATHPGSNASDAFSGALRLVFKSSTWSDNSRAWNAAGDVEGEQERWKAFGRTPNGEWCRFFRVWRQNK